MSLDENCHPSLKADRSGPGVSGFDRFVFGRGGVDIQDLLEVHSGN